jgi:hypothetical protein
MVTLAQASNPSTQRPPDLSGTWILDRARSGPTTDVWGQLRPQRFVIVHTSSEVSLDTGDGSIVGVDGPLVFRLDGIATIVVDRSVGDLPDFARKIRTEAAWEGDKLVTRTTHFAEKRGASGQPEIVPGAITRILILSLIEDGSRLVVERTGSRARPPAKLHGRPYRQEDDLVYARDTVVYLRLGRS